MPVMNGLRAGPLPGSAGGAAEAAGPPLGFRVLARVDALVNRVFTQRWNPLYHSGSIALALFGVLLLTGLYLLLFYRIGAPFESVHRIDGQAWSGRWIRSLHRFASDAVLVAAGVHAFRMYAQRRTWGARTLAWLSGVALVGAVLVAGWTGYVLVWDEHAQLLAIEGARLLDVLPFFSEPIGRSFVGESALPGAFFFLNLFAHIALPIGLGVLAWVHVARLARPVLLPERRVLWWTFGALALLSVAWPIGSGEPADLFRLPSDVPLDWFFGFWLPAAQRLPAWGVWLAGGAVLLCAAAIPWWTRPRVRALPAPAEVDTRTCTGCEQCVRDCPYDAITMVARTDGRAGQVARVDAALCTSCGVCVGSCPPMSIGPVGLSGRQQVADVRAFLAEHGPGSDDVVIVGCAWSAARDAASRHGALYFDVDCIGSMHSSTVELLLKGGAGGVLVAGCASHDGRTREGVAWTDERLFHGRLADLKPRVGRERIRLIQASLGEGAVLHDAVRSLAHDLRALDGTAAPLEVDAPDLVALCGARTPPDPSHQEGDA